MTVLPANCTRIAHGVMNRVFVTADQAAVYKLAGSPTAGVYRSLAREVAAYTFLRTWIPGLTPAVVHTELPEFLILSYVPGVPLGPLRAQLPPAERAKLIQNLGAMLRKIHTIPLADISPQLHWSYTGNSWPERALAAFVAGATTIAQTHPELQMLMHVCRDRLERESWRLGRPDEALIHGDFGGANVIVSPTDLSIAGVVDWEWAAVADPELDIARLHWLDRVGRSAHIWSNRAEQLAFYEGYGQQPYEVETFSGKYRWYGLWFASGYVAVRLQRGLLDECKPLIAYLQREVVEDWM